MTCELLCESCDIATLRFSFLGRGFSYMPTRRYRASLVMDGEVVCEDAVDFTVCDFIDVAGTAGGFLRRSGLDGSAIINADQVRDRLYLVREELDFDLTLHQPAIWRTT